MNFDDTPAEAAFRAKARAWLDANSPVELAEDLATSGFAQVNVGARDLIQVAKDWQRKKFDAGWAVPRWPKEYGGAGLSPIEAVIWAQEEGDYTRLSGPFTIGFGMCGPTVMAWADEDTRLRLLPRLASGEDIWCQLFSEPVAGSDLAGIRTRAARDGDDWIINGQKIWTSGAHNADFGLLLARTDPTVAKHKGLTMFWIDMHDPAVEVRPIRQVNEDSAFNEVYFTDLRIKDSQRLGDVGQGWQVALTTLMNERLSIGTSMTTGFEEIFAFCKTVATPHGPAIDDPRIRSRLADFAIRASGLRYNGFRALTALSRGEQPGPENSIGKLVAGSTMQEVAKLAIELQGEAGLLNDPAAAPASARFQAMLLRSPATRIEGGTDEILRNIIAERVLGLPVDIRVDKNLPFNQIPTG